MKVDGRILVLKDGSRWRAFAPSWRLWRWLGYLWRRLLVVRLPGALLPSVGWSPGRRVDLLLGQPRRPARVLAEKVGDSYAEGVQKAPASFDRGVLKLPNRGRSGR